MAKYMVAKTDSSDKNQIHPHEPCFVFRATDQFTPEVVQFYHDLCDRNGAPKEFLDAILEHLDRIKAWQYLNKDKVKYPD